MIRMEFFEQKYILFYTLALVAEILGTVSGFGSSILFVPIASYFFDFHEVLGITALFHVFSNTSKMLLFRQAIDKRILLFMGLPAFLFVSIGAWLSRFAPVDGLKLILSIFLLAISVFLMAGKDRKTEANTKNLILGGTLSGLIAGMVGTGGAIRGITLSAFSLSKELFIATSAWIDFGVDASRLAIYSWNGYVRADFLYMIPILILISLVGSFLGKKIVLRISESIFRKIVLTLIISLSLLELANYIWKQNI